MIKESFLRNFSLSKLYHEAEEEKNKLKVFYMRKVRTIMREKHEKERLIQRQKISQENREERGKKRLKIKVKTEFNQHDASYNYGEGNGRSLIIQQNKFKERKKTELKLIQYKLNILQNDVSEFTLRPQKLKSLRSRIYNSIIHSQKTNQDEVQDNQYSCFRKNTINKSLMTTFANHTMEGDPNKCRNQSIIFISEQSRKSKRTLRFVDQMKENQQLKKIITKIEPIIASNT